MKIRMKVSVSGPRHDGRNWPPTGQEIDVPDWEGADLCASGMAEPVATDKVEKAVAPKAEERSEPKKETADVAHTRYEERTIVQLRELARERGVSVAGNKDELIARLRGEE